LKLKEFILFLGTEDLGKTADFYLKVLEFKLYKNQELCQIFSITKDSKIGFCSHMPVVCSEKSPIITLVTTKVDEFYEKMVSNDILISQKPKLNNQFKIYHFFFKDPNGYTIEVQKFVD
jgi:catechol 2,3-dioxygenase-like lactoylglutathione lyase family enzyme